MNDQETFDKIKIAKQISEQKKQEAEAWLQEQFDIIDAATEKKKKDIRKDYDETYENAKKKIYSSIYQKFNQLMRMDGTTVTQYATNTPELLKYYDFLTEKSERSSSKNSHSSNSLSNSPFEEDSALILNILKENGHDVENMTIWSDGTLFHKGKFYSQKDVVKIRNRQNEVQLMKIDLITKTEFVLDQSGEKLIISPDDLASQRYQILPS